MQTIKHVIISAAGIGSRLGINIPKCLVTVGGKKIIDYQLDNLQDIDDVRVVVGFQEEKVIEHVSKVRSNAIFVRNPLYSDTSTLQSIFLGAKYLNEPILVLDGDVILEKESFRDFLKVCQIDVPVIAVTPSGTEDAVFVQTHVNDNGDLLVDGFQREPKTNFEWTGIAYLKPEQIEYKNIFVYEALKKHVPLYASIIKCFEIDTQADLLRANTICSDWGIL